MTYQLIKFISTGILKTQSSTPRKRRVSFVDSSSSDNEADVTLKTLRKKKIKPNNNLDIRQEVNSIMKNLSEAEIHNLKGKTGLVTVKPVTCLMTKEVRQRASTKLVRKYIAEFMNSIISL